MVAMTKAILAVPLAISCAACVDESMTQLGPGPASVTDVFSLAAAACEGQGFGFSEDLGRYVPRADVLRTREGRVLLDRTAQAADDSDRFVGFQGQLFCAVRSTNPTPTWNRFVLNYKDPVDQVAIPEVVARVIAELKYLDESGQETVVVRLRSSEFNGVDFGSRFVALEHVFDFARRFYFVHIVFHTELDRPSPEVGGIRLEHNPGNEVVTP
jgi:hypothetical protein